MKVVFFDLQSVRGHVWNISAVVAGEKNLVFDIFIRPQLWPLPKPPSDKLFAVTHEFLDSVGANTINKGLAFFAHWLFNLQDDVLLVAHGCYRRDKPLLEEIIQKHNISFPLVRFYDSLLHFRKSSPNLKSYSLKNLSKSFLKTPFKNGHLSLYNVYLLNSLLCNNEFNNVITYGIAETPLTVLNSVGLQGERNIYDAGFTSVEQLLFSFTNQHNLDQRSFTIMLQKLHLSRAVSLNLNFVLMNLL